MYGTSIQSKTVDHSTAALKLYESASAGLSALIETLARLLESSRIDLNERLLDWRNGLPSQSKPLDLLSVSDEDEIHQAQLLTDSDTAYFCIPQDHKVELVISGDREALSKLAFDKDINRLLPHICQAISICQKLSQQKHELGSINKVLFHYPIPALAVDNHLNTIFVNKMLQEKLDSVSPLTDSRQVSSWQERAREYIDLLKLCDTTSQRADLKKALTICTQASQEQSVLCRISVEGDDYPIIVSPVKAVPSLFRHYARSSVAWVYLLDASYSQALRESHFFKHLALSKTEKELCVLLFEGKHLNDIAELRRVSDQTVRKQLQSVLRKTQLECQEELIIFLFNNCIEYGLIK